MGSPPIVIVSACADHAMDNQPAACMASSTMGAQRANPAGLVVEKLRCTDSPCGAPWSRLQCGIRRQPSARYGGAGGKRAVDPASPAGLALSQILLMWSWRS